MISLYVGTRTGRGPRALIRGVRVAGQPLSPARLHTLAAPLGPTGWVTMAVGFTHRHRDLP
jgi:hypothetical protein